jgi:PBP1b-binding outer membrane lipoprotein LpoB
MWNYRKGVTMKKNVIILGCIVVLLASCSGLTNTPKATAQKFYKALEKNDTKALAEVATPETVQLIAMFGTKIQGMMASYGKIKSITEAIEGDTAVATVVFENGEETNLDLIKVDGKWKVSMSMDK